MQSGGTGADDARVGIAPLAGPTRPQEGHKNEEEAYQSLLAVEEVAWCAPTKASKVIVKAMRPSESSNEFLNRPQHSGNKEV